MLLHACAHNPTGEATALGGAAHRVQRPWPGLLARGRLCHVLSVKLFSLSTLLLPSPPPPPGVDPTEGQWRELSQLLKQQKLLPMLDCAYQVRGRGWRCCWRCCRCGLQPWWLLSFRALLAPPLPSPKCRSPKRNSSGLLTARLHPPHCASPSAYAGLCLGRLRPRRAGHPHLCRRWPQADAVPGGERLQKVWGHMLLGACQLCCAERQQSRASSTGPAGRRPVRLTIHPMLHRAWICPCPPPARSRLPRTWACTARYELQTACVICCISLLSLLYFPPCIENSTVNATLCRNT